MRAQERADEGKDAALQKPAAASGRDRASVVLQLQAGAGNAAVTRLIQRLVKDGVKSKAGEVAPAVADTYLDHWERLKEKDINLTVDSDDVLGLAERFLSTSPEAQLKSLAADDMSKVPARLDDLLKGRGRDEAREKIKELATTANKQVSEVTYKGWAFEVAQRKRGALQTVILAAYKQRASILNTALAKMRGIAKGVGLPALDEATVGEFKALEGIKDRARAERAPLDKLLSKYVKDVEAIIPGAALVYRGSLARGVKSPSKYVHTDEGAALASFDDEDVNKADPAKRWASETEDASYDVDANIEIPDKTFQRLGLQTGPLSKASASILEVRQLRELQKKINEDIVTNLGGAMPALDMSDKFEFFLNSISKAEAQLSSGTPYPPGMLEASGFPALAANLPSAFSRELVSKVTEYYTAHMMYKGKVLPLPLWERYFRELFEHVKTSGPLAVFMPEVQVDVTRGKEFTASATPRDTTDITGPTDLVARGGHQFIGVPANAGQVVRNAEFAGTIDRFENARSGNVHGIVRLGATECICFDTHNHGVGWVAVYKVTRLPGAPGQKPVVEQVYW